MANPRSVYFSRAGWSGGVATGALRLGATGLNAATAFTIVAVYSNEYAAACFLALAASSMLAPVIIGGHTNELLSRLLRTDAVARAEISRALVFGVLIAAEGGALAGGILSPSKGPPVAHWVALAGAVTLHRSADLALSETLRAAGRIGSSNAAVFAGAVGMSLILIGPIAAPTSTRPYVSLALAITWAVVPMVRTHRTIRSAERIRTLASSSLLAAHEASRSQFFVNAAVAALAGGLDVLLAPVILGSDRSASYSLGFRFAMLVSFPVLTLGVRIGPVLAKASTENQQKVVDLLARYSEMTRRATALSVGIVVVPSIVWYTVIAQRVDDRQWHAAISVFVVLGIAHIVNTVFGPTFASLIALGRPREMRQSMTAGLAALVCVLTSCAALSVKTPWLYALGSVSQLVVQNVLGYRTMRRVVGRSAAAWDLGSPAAIQMS